MAIDMLPYKQGSLDGLCGVYSVINATRLLVKNILEEECMKLFKKCLTHVEQKKSLSKVITTGISKRDLWSVLKNVVMENYPITSQNSFRGVKDISVKDFFGEIQSFLKEDGKRTVIVGLDCHDWDHWTVIKSVSAKRVTLFDSSMMKTINISRCVLKKTSKGKPYKFALNDTFFLYGREQQ